jgi:hypothetical protein
MTNDAIRQADHLNHEAGTADQPGATEANRILFLWIEALGTGDIETLLMLYASDAILVPTLQDDLCTTTADRRRYFEVLLANPGFRCEMGFVQNRTGPASGVVTAAGHYRFVMTGSDGQEVTIPARFLFTFEQVRGIWRITGHHSSRMAEPV